MKERIERLKHLKNERGLTLVELLAVIVILAIVAVIAFVMIGNVMENARKDAHISNAQQLIAAAKLYDATVNEIPTGGVTAAELNTAGLLDPLIDPWDATNTSYSGTVTKSTSGGVTYSVAMSGSGKCDFAETSEQDLAAQGKDICP